MTPRSSDSNAWRFPSGMSLVDHLCSGWSMVVFLFLYLPILLLIVYSFNASETISVWDGFSFTWYQSLWQNRPLLEATKNSLIIASATTVLSVFIGTSGAWLLHRYQFAARRTLLAFTIIPILIPEVIMGVSLLILFTTIAHPLNLGLATFTEWEFSRGFITTIIAHTTFCFPFVLIAVQARLDGIDPHLEEAALDLGARPIQAFWKVMVPYLLPGIISGALMSFTLSMDEVIVTFFVTGPEAQTLPLKIFGLAKKGLDPSINAISAIFILVTGLLVVLANSIRKINA